MGQENTAPRKINGVEGALGQIMQSQGPGVVEQWTNPSDIGVDYGLSFIGTVTGIAGAPKFQCSGLIGFGEEFFKSYWAYVVWDADGAGAQPQGQMLECTGYATATGDFTVAAFAPNAIAVGDKVLFLHPSIAATRRMLDSLDFWSDPQEEIQVPAVAGTLVFTPTVTVADLPVGATVVRAFAMFKFRMVENTADAPNALDGPTVAATSQVIQVKETAGGAYVDAINFADNQFSLVNLTREGGDAYIGSPDIAGEVDGNDSYTFQWLLRKCDADFINFNDCQVGLRIWYSV